MKFIIYWSFLIVTVFSSLCLGAWTRRKNCTKDDLSITGGDYTLTNGLAEGSLLVYQCPEGYYPFPKLSRRCHVTGRWSPAPTKNKPSVCRRVTCPDPLVLENGSVFPNELKYYVTNVTEYKCFDGYRFRGSASRVCQSNGKWSGDTPICDLSSDHCSDPGVPPGARRTGHHFGIDDKVTYRCNEDLIMVGSQERTCREDQQWSGVEPTCYYAHTYDTPEEVTAAFASSLSNRIELSGIEDNSTTDQYGKKFRLDRSGKIHIYIALDSSDSVLQENFDWSKSSVKKLIERISYFDTTPRYDILAFATEVEEIVNIANPEWDKIDVLKELDKFTYEAKGDKSGTNIALAFSKIEEKMSFMKQQTKEDFKDIQQVIIVFTDGMANMGGSADQKVNKIRSLMYSVHQANSENYLDIYAFGVGPEINEEEINKLVSKKDKEQHFFKMKDIKSLETTFDKMIDESNVKGLCGLYKGHESGRKKHPWLVKVFFSRYHGASSCLGALVTTRFVLTAAHCFKFEDQLETIKVQLSDKEKYDVKRFIIHPKFNIKAKMDAGIPEFYDFDVALIELKEDLMESVEVRPICIPCTDQTSQALGLSGHVRCKQHEEQLLKSKYEDASFMSLKNNGLYIWKNVTIKLDSARASCIEDAKKVENMTATDANQIVTEQFLCTGGIEDKTNNVACKGDSGGALFVEKKKRLIQVGVISWGVKDLCTEQNSMAYSDGSSRDFHINLFKVQPFLRQYLAAEDSGYAPLTFID